MNKEELRKHKNKYNRDRYFTIEGKRFFCSDPELVPEIKKLYEELRKQILEDAYLHPEKWLEEI